MINKGNIYKRHLLVINIFVALFILAVFAPSVNAGTQAVSFSPGEVVILRGESAAIGLTYNVSVGEKITTGLGIRIHYNSKVIGQLRLQNIFVEGLVGRHYEAQDDINDLDRDPLTDKYLCIAWMSIFGEWPSSAELPVDLAKVLLQVRSDAEGSETRLNITSTSTPMGYRFNGGSVLITIP